jgi:hypothetical protein
MEAKRGNNSRQSSGNRLSQDKLDIENNNEHDWAQEKFSGEHKSREGKSIDQLSIGKPSSISDSKPRPYCGIAASKVSSDSFDVAEEKARLLEIQQELEVEEEFERLKIAPAVPVSCVAKSATAREFVRGFNMY